MESSFYDTLVQQYNTINTELNKVNKQHQSKRALLDQKTQKIEDYLNTLPNNVLVIERDKLCKKIVECEKQIESIEQQIKEYKNYVQKFDKIICNNCTHHFVLIYKNYSNGIELCSLCGRKHYIDFSS
jgi:chromosome condensin MukBEF ATPase and DNA-binding subunit MukB